MIRIDQVNDLINLLSLNPQLTNQKFDGCFLRLSTYKSVTVQTSYNDADMILLRCIMDTLTYPIC